jgi:hypothetical protein
MVKLWCAVVGRPGDAFSVNIDEGQTVEDLKEAIKAKNPATITDDAKDLQLFLAKKDRGAGDWLTENDVKGGATNTTGLKPLDAVRTRIWRLGLSGENVGGVDEEKEEQGLGPVHVLVAIPGEPPTPLEPPVSLLVVDGANIHVTETVALNPPALVAFWEAFLAVPTEIQADAVVVLPEGVFLLGDPTQGSRIFIRRCYPPLLDVSWKFIHDKATETPHLVILGNPGIGKTFFGYVILLHLARTGATVVYESGGSKKRYLFSRDMVVQGSQQDFVGILDKSTTYYIVDAVKPTYYPAKTILLTSPRHNVWFEFNKTNCRTRYMPVWSRREIFKCRELIYPDIPAAVVQSCFRRWGGIARYVLRYAQIDDQQVLLENAIDIVDINLLVDACGQLDANETRVSHRLLHYRVNTRFTNEYFVFASQYVQQEVYKRLYMKDKQKLVDFISASDGIGAVAVLRGHLFEGHVHSVLPRGGTFRVRRLVDNGEAYDDEDEYLTEEEDDDNDDDDAMDVDDNAAMEGIVAATSDLADEVVSIQLSPRATFVFSNGEEVIAANTTSYLRPMAKNYKSVDAIIKPDELF